MLFYVVCCTPHYSGTHFKIFGTPLGVPEVSSRLETDARKKNEEN